MLIDAFTPDWLDKLEAAGPAYLLLDGAFIPAIHKRFGNDVRFLFEHLPGWRDAVRDVSPFMFRFDGRSLAQKQALNECSGWPMISAIRTSESLDTLAQRLARWCVVQAAGQHINLRFPDTRRLPDIYGVLCAEQRADMFGPAVRYSYLGRDGVWNHIALDGKVQPSQGEPKLSDEQFNELLVSSEGDSMLAQLERRSVSNSSIARSAQYSAVCAAIALGKAQKLARNEMLDLCEQAMSYPQQISNQVG